MKYPVLRNLKKLNESDVQDDEQDDGYDTASKLAKELHGLVSSALEIADALKAPHIKEMAKTTHAYFGGQVPARLEQAAKLAAKFAADLDAITLQIQEDIVS